MEKKVYEAPEVTMVVIDFSDRIIAAGCSLADCPTPVMIS